MPTPSAQRTRSRRNRSGTRRNKKHPIAHIQLCPEPHRCLVHIVTTRFFPPAEPMRMRLTRCEQKWVDDLRAGRMHGHIKPRMRLPHSREWALLALRKRVNTARMKAAGTVNESNHIHLHMGDRSNVGYHTPGDSIVLAQDYANPRQSEAIYQQVIQVGAANYPRRMDISDRWYPRGN